MDLQKLYPRDNEREKKLAFMGDLSSQQRSKGKKNQTHVSINTIYEIILRKLYLQISIASVHHGVMKSSCLFPK